MNQAIPLCSVVIVTFNSKRDLEGCLASLRRQSMQDFEVIVVDNGSTDGSPDWVETHHPEARVHRSGANLGFAGGVNAGFERARGRFLVSVNADTELHHDWLGELVRELAAHPEAGLVTSRICYFDHRDRVNACGNEVHLSGFGFCRGLDRPSTEYQQPARVTSVSGCAFAIRREVVDEIGGLDDDYFLYVEDTDISLRANLAGYQVRYAPASIAYHKYELKLHANKFYLLERNRSLTLVKHLHGRTLALLLPALLPVELLMWVYAAIHGPSYVAAKFRAHRWFLRNRALVRDKRRRTQALRRVDDRYLLRLLTPRLPVEQILDGLPGATILGNLGGAVFSLLSAAARAFAR